MRQTINPRKKNTLYKNIIIVHGQFDFELYVYRVTTTDTSFKCFSDASKCVYDIYFFNPFPETTTPTQQLINYVYLGTKNNNNTNTVFLNNISTLGLFCVTLFVILTFFLCHVRHKYLW